MACILSDALSLHPRFEIRIGSGGRLSTASAARAEGLCSIELRLGCAWKVDQLSPPRNSPAEEPTLALRFEAPQLLAHHAHTSTQHTRSHTHPHSVVTCNLWQLQFHSTWLSRSSLDLDAPHSPSSSSSPPLSAPSAAFVRVSTVHSLRPTTHPSLLGCPPNLVTSTPKPTRLPLLARLGQSASALPQPGPALHRSLLALSILSEYS